MKMKHVGLYNDGHFGAQSLHLRCGLVSPSSWHHAVRYLPNMQDSVLERWLAFLQTGFSPVELSELSLAHSFSASPTLHRCNTRTGFTLTRSLVLSQRLWKRPPPVPPEVSFPDKSRNPDKSPLFYFD